MRVKRTNARTGSFGTCRPLDLLSGNRMFDIHMRDVLDAHGREVTRDLFRFAELRYPFVEPCAVATGFIAVGGHYARSAGRWPESLIRVVEGLGR